MWEPHPVVLVMGHGIATALGQRRRLARPDAASWSALWTLDGGILNSRAMALMFRCNGRGVPPLYAADGEGTTYFGLTPIFLGSRPALHVKCL